MPKKASYLPSGQRFFNFIFKTLVQLGRIPGAHLLRAPGRKSGKMYITPIFVLKLDGQRWLVAGFKNSDWVKNIRASGWGELVHDRQVERVKFIEETSAERASLLREFVRRAPGANRGYTISPNASLEEYEAIVPEHPIFRILEA
ncbi:DUF385 domain-containing protein [Ktedonosporobacter rubrisoli]|uniref:DUF385 domain-containing protein n=1 Tax=Ktedonosporobacter rubrisoli TaxID=2509675 RepID=A0A4V0YZI5_KTERU|nr:nitroreductase/quinone reductase family protein [Ktedonosporobacter rubrisoli]QBD79841.1 DUF385 domain-containing protein [Ktedonosporobacter rubrisoli]